MSVVEWLESDEGEVWSRAFHKKMKCPEQGSSWFQLREYVDVHDPETNFWHAVEIPVAWYQWEVFDAAIFRDLIPAESGVAT